jgi:hypothetical protein
MPEHALAPAGRRIALIAHDNKKRDMLEWAEYNLDLLAGHELFATATTGHLLQKDLGTGRGCAGRLSVGRRSVRTRCAARGEGL